jgi:hypothetical protein
MPVGEALMETVVALQRHGETVSLIEYEDRFEIVASSGFHAILPMCFCERAKCKDFGHRKNAIALATRIFKVTA